MTAGRAGGPLPPGFRPRDPDRPLTPFQHAVVAVVRDLRPGEVLTYGEVAEEAGHPGSGQAVANVLRTVEDLPWWRVIPGDRRIYCSHEPVQVPLLRAEGVEVGDDRRLPRGDGQTDMSA